jgi:hypothetical protein
MRTILSAKKGARDGPNSNGTADEAYRRDVHQPGEAHFVWIFSTRLLRLSPR